MNDQSITEVSQARLFATQYARNAAKNMLDAIQAINSRAARITKIALGVSMPHQIGYILALGAPHMHWGTPSAILESITIILLALGAPIATDLLILCCIETIGAVAATRGSKIRALALMLIPIGASGTVNFLAPAPTLIKVLAAFIVTIIPMAESLRLIRPDFAKIEAMETAVVAQVTPEPIAIAAQPSVIEARVLADYQGMDRATKVAFTKVCNTAGTAAAVAQFRRARRAASRPATTVAAPERQPEYTEVRGVDAMA